MFVSSALVIQYILPAERLCGVAIIKLGIVPSPCGIESITQVFCFTVVYPNKRLYDSISVFN